MNNLRDDAKSVELLSYHIEEILKILGEDPSREGLIKTPERAAKALLYITGGYNETVKDAVGDAIFESPSNDMVIVRDIEFYTICEHHLLPFFGNISIGYIPEGKIIGLSKLARVVNLFSRRLQVQEKLTYQICDALTRLFPNKGFIVYSRANHLCMKMRGVEKQESSTVSLASTGLFREHPQLTQQFFQSIG